MSKKLTPSSTARRTAAADSPSSTSPQPSGLPSMVNGPPIAQHPNPISLTSMPLRPKTLPIAVPSLSPLPGTQPRPWSALQVKRSTARRPRGPDDPPRDGRRSRGRAALFCLTRGGPHLKNAFVLGGGGVLGAYEVGMLRALDYLAGL